VRISIELRGLQESPRRPHQSQGEGREMKTELDLKITVTPEQINESVIRAVQDSAIGKVIQDGINKAIAGYDNPVEKAVKVVVMDSVNQIVRDQYRDQIAEFVREKITDDLMREIIDAAWDQFTHAMRQVGR